MSEKYLFLCAYGCGDIPLEDMVPTDQPEEDPGRCCPKCGNDAFFIVPNDKEIANKCKDCIYTFKPHTTYPEREEANDHEQREFEEVNSND